MNLRRVDLNLLPILRELLRSRSVTRTGEQLGLSQSAVSAALGRLRELLKDDLLIPVGRSMQPTELALRILEPLELALDHVDRALTGPRFMPERIDRHFVIATADYVSFLLAAPLATRVAREAPAAQLQFVDFARDPISELRSGRVDLLLSPDLGFGGAPKISRRSLLIDSMVCLVAKDHPTIQDTIDLATYLALPHATFRGIRGGGPEQRTLGSLDLQPSNLVFVPDFVLLAEIVAGTSCIAMVHRRLAERMATRIGVRFLPPPIDIPPVEIQMFWNAHQDKDLEHIWMRDLISEISHSM